MHNPFRSEQEMFRVVLIVGAAMGAVIAVAVIVSPLAGAIALAAEAAAAVGLVLAGSRGSEPHTHEVAAADDDIHRVLVVANQTVGGAALLSEIQGRCGDRKSQILVITPALASSGLAHWASDIDEGIEVARERLERSVSTLRGLGLNVRGEVGDHDPNTAIEDALRAFAADEVVIATHPPERSRWLEHGVVERARAEVPLPLTHVIVDLEQERTEA